ncbi:MAG: hypothetical protein K2Y37_06675 [Pirellulales bacterium]|nr:hypothetical protein [Pirellulales bacterium]
MERFSNDAATVIDQVGGIDDDDTTVDVASATGFPTLAQYRIRIDDEIILVTSGAGTTTWTISRGEEGTVAASHSDGAAITHVLTAGALRQFKTDLGFGFVEPDVGDFTFVNQGSAVAFNSNGRLILDGPVVAGENVRILKKVAPSAPFTITAAFRRLLNPVSARQWCGLCFRNSSSGKLACLAFNAAATDSLFTTVSTYLFTDPQAFDSMPFARSPLIGSTNLIWAKIEDDNTNRKYYVSLDGTNWRLVFSEGRTTFLTADEVGLCLAPHGSGGEFGAQMILHSWEEA